MNMDKNELPETQNYLEFEDVVAAVRNLHPLRYSHRMLLDSTAVTKHKLTITVTFRKDLKKRSDKE